MEADRDGRRLGTLARRAGLSVLALGLGLFVSGVVGSDAGAGATAPARVVVLVSLDGEPADALVQALDAQGVPVRVAYTPALEPGRVELELPPGRYTLSVERGVGFLGEPVRLELTLAAGEVRELDVQLSQRFDPRTRGYYSVDPHAHSEAGNRCLQRDFGLDYREAETPPDALVGVQLAEGLDVVFLSDHNCVDGHAPFAGTARARGVPFVLSEEVTTLKWGHFNPYSLEEGALVRYDPTRAPADYFEEARANGATIVQVNHPLWSGGGYFFTQNRPEFDGSFDVLEVFNGPYTEDDRYTIERLFRLWNEGKRYVAVGVSDDHDWLDLSVRYGTPRTYVRLDSTAPLRGQGDARALLEALKAGRAFATYGPLVFVETAEGALPGDALEREPGEPLKLLISVQSVRPLDGARLEIIKNGRKAAMFELSGHEQLLEFEDRPTRSAWYAARLRTPAQDLALTNPIWVEIQP